MIALRNDSGFFRLTFPLEREEGDFGYVEYSSEIRINYNAPFTVNDIPEYAMNRMINDFVDAIKLIEPTRGDEKILFKFEYQTDAGLSYVSTKYYFMNDIDYDAVYNLYYNSIMSVDGYDLDGSKLIALLSKPMLEGD